MPRPSRSPPTPEALDAFQARKTAAEAENAASQALKVETYERIMGLKAGGLLTEEAIEQVARETVRPRAPWFAHTLGALVTLGSG